MTIGFGSKSCPVSSNLISVPETELQGRENQGLPDEKSRRDLARTYLEVQTRHWPELVALGVLPPLTEENVNRLAEEFAECFLSASVDAFQTTLVPLPWQELAKAYLRYSCDNSNPRSLDKQLRNILEKAARDRVLIPWRDVFADAAISGTVATRREYQLVDFVKQHFLTKEVIERAVEEANRYLHEEARRPKADLRPIIEASQSESRSLGLADREK